MVDNMDQGIGRIVAELRTQGYLENTLLFFLQDGNAGVWPANLDLSGYGEPNNSRTDHQEIWIGFHWEKPFGIQTDPRGGAPRVFGRQKKQGGRRLGVKGSAANLRKRFLKRNNHEGV